LGLPFLLGAIFIGVALRLWVSQLGATEDLITWRLVGDLSLQGKNVYASSDRYSYGPIWFLVMHGLRWFQIKINYAPNGQESLHLLVVIVLSLADALAAVCLYRRNGLGPALFFILNPVLILLTGYHSQLDTLAILFGLLAWMLLESESVSWIACVAAALLLGLSLSIKHVLIFFPLWLAFSNTTFKRPGQRFLVPLLVYGLFLSSFIPFASAPGAMAGIRNHVFGYSGLPSQKTLIAGVLNLLFPMPSLDRLAPGANFVLFKALFTVGVLVIGWFISRDRPREMLERYLLALFALMASAAPQYLAIPLLACAVMDRKWMSWTYLAAALAFLLVSPENISNLYIDRFPWIVTVHTEFAFWNVQIWAALLLCSGWLLLRRHS
jgi:hypothetical protein